MSSSFPYYIINDLPEIQFIAGTKQQYTFTIYDSGSTAQNLNASTQSWQLAYYGMGGSSILTKTGAYSGSPNNEFIITLDPADTLYLSGKFIQQIVLTNLAGSTFRPSQGIITIIPAII
jgi:hypothetical protein